MNAKSIFKSKTFWVQVFTVLAMLVPQLQQWLLHNPVAGGSAIAAVNLLVRFFTSGAVYIYPPQEDDDFFKPSSGKSGLVLLLLCAGCLCGLSSCTLMQNPDGSMSGGVTITTNDIKVISDIVHEWDQKAALSKPVKIVRVEK